MEQFKDKFHEVELITSTKYYSEFVNGFENVRKLAELEGQLDNVRLAQYEIEICSLQVRNRILSLDKQESRFGALLGYDNGTEWPDIKKFDVDQFKYYEERLLKTDNVFLKARYSDFLFEFGKKKITMNKYQISEYLLTSLEKIIDHYRSAEENFEYISAVARLVEVSLLMGHEKQLKEVVNLLYSQLIEWNKNNEYHWIIEFSKILREIINSRFNELVPTEMSTLILEVIEKVRLKYLEDKEYQLHKVVCDEFIQYRKLNLISLEKENELQLEIGKGYELESEYQQGRQNKSLVVKASFLERAMKHYANIGNKEKISEMKILIKQAYEQYEQSDEMERMSVPIEIPSDIINKIVEAHISSDIESSLDLIARSDCFIPKVNAIEEQVNKQDRAYPMQSLLSKSIISDGKKVEHTITEEDLKKINFISNYMCHLTVNLEVLIKFIFEKLIGEYDLGVDKIMKKFDRWGLLDNRNRPFIEIGMKNFFEGDYISSVHILVPQFESTLRRLFSNAGFPTTSIKKGTAQHEETFNEFLNREDIKSSLGNDIHKLIQIVMVEQAGLNLRNQIAHGLINFSSITKAQCLLVIYLFLVLTRFETSNE
ncbi:MULTISPECIES: DUF4209 domain-containing protein [Bacillus]|uniref:DUF4209 domain-containing protein n=1 Tax=Bacillus TaxID=1386 RepID=UPI000E2F82CD|nr:DUF4209 domain-containing protein [Bacillus sp. HMG]RFB42839.1 DUF4209 domain-containing protein [Bacillus sp. HMG]